jgi:DNA-binding MarR family transcriptional regulator
MEPVNSTQAVGLDGAERLAVDRVWSSSPCPGIGNVKDVDTLLNRLCHLMVAFERAIGDAPDDSGRRLGLDMPGLAVIVSLDLFGELRPTSIAELLGGTTSMATKVLGRLERAGYVDRRLGSFPDDRRAVAVQLSERGRRAIDVCDRELAELSVDLLAAMAAVDFGAHANRQGVPSDEPLPGERLPSTGPGLAEFLRFVVEIDKPILATVGQLDSLHPADPRGLLVLSELDMHGPIRIGALPGLIDRSRNAAERVVQNLQSDGFVERLTGKMPDDRRAVVVEVTAVGCAVVRGVVAAISAHLPELRPSMTSLSLALSGERQGLGAKTG